MVRTYGCPDGNTRRLRSRQSSGTGGVQASHLIKTADRAAAYLEATRLAGFEPAEAKKFFGHPPKFSAAIERDYLTPWPANTASSRYRDQVLRLVTA